MILSIHTVHIFFLEAYDFLSKKLIDFNRRVDVLEKSVMFIKK